MSILDRSALEASPLADLHALASELSIDGYRRLRRPELIDAIIDRQGGPPEEPGVDEPTVEEPTVEEPTVEEPTVEEPAGDEGSVEVRPMGEAEDERAATRRRRGRRGGRGRTAAREESGPTPEAAEEIEEEADRVAGEEPEAERGAAEQVVEGEVELLPNGSGFLRVQPPDPSEDDVYISAAQVKRCELVPGDQISGPRRAPRRSERFASLIRIDTINGRPAEEVADSTRFEDLPAAFPSDRFPLGSEDPTIKAIDWLTPFGRGSRVTIVGPARSGKTEALRRLATALAGQDDIELLLVLAGVRPEEISEWQQGPLEPLAAVSFAASGDAQAQTIERAVDQARRLAARGAHAVVLIDTLSGLPPHAARKPLAAARNIAGGASLTVIATAAEPLGGETTVITLDPVLASTGRFPAVDLIGSWTIRPELLVGEAGAEAIVRARMEAVDR
jgi:transcription termination factor Rho